MPYLMLIDSADGKADSVIGHTVTDRDGARRVLVSDLQNTADPEWVAILLARFDSGANVVTMPNGEGHAFRVEYKENRR